MDNKIKNIIDYTIKNGGCSFNSKLEILEDLKGYTISIQKYEYKTTIKNIDEIEKNIKNKIEIVGNKKNFIIGLWIDGGILYIDINKMELNHTRAVEFAKSQKQLAIYDNNKKVVEYIKKDYTYILYELIEEKNDLRYIMEYTKKELINKLHVRDLEYYKKFIYNDFVTDIKEYFIKNHKKYILIKEEL